MISNPIDELVREKERDKIKEGEYRNSNKKMHLHN